MHKQELEERLREQLEESKECIRRLLDQLDFIRGEWNAPTFDTTNSVVYNDAEKLLERLNEK